jgi:uncharacterized protein (DUF58 family)
MKGKVPTLILVIFSLMLMALLTRNGDLAWMAIPFLAYLGMGILQSPVTGKRSLQARRVVEKESAGGVSCVHVSTTVCNQDSRIIFLRLSDALQPGMRFTGGQIQAHAALRGGESVELGYTFQAPRGNFSWSSVHATLSDPLGLFETRLDLPAVAEVQVQAELKKFRPFHLQPQHTLHSSGPIPARLGGSGINFWGVREYHPGDPLRRLDWRRMARHSHQFFTKEFEQEEIADIGLILDARQKTDLRIGEDSLFEHSVRAAASLAEVFLSQGNRVSLLVYGKQTVSLFPGYGKVQLNRILHTLSQVTVAADDNSRSLDSIPLNIFPSHAFLLVLSPLAPNDWLLFPRLRAYGHQVLLISPDPIEFARPLLTTDLVTRLATRLTKVEREREFNKIAHLWIPVIDWQVSRPLSPLIRAALSHSHIQRER